MVSQPEISSKYKASREIDSLLDPEERPRDRLGQLCRAMLAHQGAEVRTLSNSDAVSRVLSPTESGRNQRFFAAVFLRLLSILPKEVHDLDNDSRVRVTKLLEKIPKVSQALDIDRKSQGYERLRALERGADRADEYLIEALTPPKPLAAFDQVRRRIMRVYQNPLVGAIAGPFLPDFLSKRAISVILDTVHNYVTAGPRFTMTRYTDAKEVLEAVLNDCTRYNTRLVTKFFQPFFTALVHQMATDFESSSVNLPGRLSLTDLGKKYPFMVSDAEVRLAFAVENIGPGVAFDVELSIDVDDYLSLTSPSQFLDQVDSGESFKPIEFSATVENATRQISASLLYADVDQW